MIKAYIYRDHLLQILKFNSKALKSHLASESYDSDQASNRSLFIFGSAAQILGRTRIMYGFIGENGNKTSHTLP